MALFVALGGSSYAVTRTGFVGAGGTVSACVKTSTGTVRLIRSGARCRKHEQLVHWNQRGVKGTHGVQGAAGLSIQGPKGDQGNPGPLVSTLPTGATSTGYVSFAAPAAAASALARSSISFPFPLATAPAAHYLIAGATSPQCPGSFVAPSAASGNLCVYENPVGPLNGSVSRNVTSVSGDGTATAFGAAVFVHSAAAGDFGVTATWAVTG